MEDGSRDPGGGAGGRTSYGKDAPLDESRRTSDNAGRGAITKKPASGMRSGDIKVIIY